MLLTFALMSHPAFPGHLSHQDPDLTERQRRLFAALLILHGRTARPVGSDALGQAAGIPLSPATIRASLAELEALGLVERPHLAAGRMPSARGYEYFVRTMLVPAALPAALVVEVDRALHRASRDVEHLLNEAARVLSSLTHQLGLALAASLEDDRLSGLDLEPLDDRRALMVLDLGIGAVRTLVLELDSPLERGELAEVAIVLRERLLGRSLGEVRERLATDPELVRGSAVRLVTRAAAESWSRSPSTPLFSSGAMHIAEQPEFFGNARLGPLLRIVETGAPLTRLMVAGVEGQVGVRVGLDEDHALAGCSLVSFPLTGAVRGAVGVLGPRRMDYARALAVVDAVGTRVADLLQS